MWWCDAVLSGFTAPTDEARLQWLRILLGAACEIKFLIALTHGGWSRLTRSGFPRYVLVRRFDSMRADLIGVAYRPVLCLRAIAAAAYLLGALPRLAGLVVTAGLLFELTYAYRNNTIFLALLVGCTVLADAPGSGLVVHHRMSEANTWAQFLALLVTIDLYWNSAWQKVRSRHYTSGLILAQYTHFSARIRDRLRYREVWYPALMMRFLGDGGPTSARRWRPIALMVIVLEVALPVGLLVPATRPAAIAAGIAMHAGFLILLPRQLIGFSLGTVSAYLVFAR
jgi:hypothetical protein